MISAAMMIELIAILSNGIWYRESSIRASYYRSAKAG